MAAADDDFAFALAAVKRLLGQLQEDIADRPAQGERGKILASHVLEALKAIDSRVNEEAKRYPRRNSEHSKKAAARELRFYAQLVWGTHSALQWLQPDEARALSLGAVYFADELALALLGPGVEVTPVASSEYMYSTSTWPFDWLLEGKLGEELPQRPIPIVLAFPAHEQHTMLLHCLFAHELGHAAVRDKGLVTLTLAPIEGDAYEDWLDAAVAGMGDLSEMGKERAQTLVKLWIEELLCDALAFALLGPAYLFAFAEMGLSVGWHEPDDEHPSMALRTNLLVKFARDNGWSSFLEERQPTIWEWLQYAADGPSVVPSPIESFAERVCRKSLDTIIGLADKAVEDNRFTPQAWEAQESMLAELLENDILPIETLNGEPASHAQILFASWLQALDMHGGAPQAISLAVGETQYQRFVGKALEMSTAVRIWNQTKTA
jgi:hypothetical protein